ncbi:MAG: nucleotidyltransferase domain-containing protein [Pyrobaculum sp.]
MSEALSRLKALNPSLDVSDLEKIVSMHKGAVSVVVYGSAARGRFVRGLSDLDVLVITQNLPSRGLTLRGSSGDVNIVYMTPEEFCQALAAGNPIAVEAAEEGHVIAGVPPASVCN